MKVIKGAHAARKVSWEENAPGRKELFEGSNFKAQKDNKCDWTPCEELRMRLERQTEGRSYWGSKAILKLPVFQKIQKQ